MNITNKYQRSRATTRWSKYIETRNIEDNSKNDNETSDLRTPSLFLSLSCDRSKKRRSPTHAPEGTAAPACSETEPLCHAQLSADWLGRGRTDS